MNLNFGVLVSIFCCHLAEIRVSQTSILKIVQNVEKWLINVSKELDRTNRTLSTGTSLKQIIIRLNSRFVSSPFQY